MGRYIDGDFDHKFWFACQSSSDIQEFGGYSVSEPAWQWNQKEDLEPNKKKVRSLKTKFRSKYGITYTVFMKKIETKCYLKSSTDKETNTKRWGYMAQAAAKIELGLKIIEALEKDDCVNVNYEE